VKTSIIKPKCTLLDANIVIEAHSLGVWEEMKTRYRLILPAVVSRQEALYYLYDGRSIPIELTSQITNGDIDEYQATVVELEILNNTFENWFMQTLDSGEIEALALLQAGKATDTTFCTGDAPAIKALSMLGLSSQGISFERLLSKIGISKKLQPQFREDFFKRHSNSGSINFILGDGLRAKNHQRAKKDIGGKGVI